MIRPCVTGELAETRVIRQSARPIKPLRQCQDRRPGAVTFDITLTHPTPRLAQRARCNVLSAHAHRVPSRLILADFPRQHLQVSLTFRKVVGFLTGIQVSKAETEQLGVRF